MKNKSLKAALSVLMMMVATGSVSAEQIKRLEDSWYVGGAVGMSMLEPLTPLGSSVTDDKDMSGKLYVGVDISNQLGVEAFWSSLGKSSITGSAGEGSIEYSALGVNGIYHVPMYAGRIHPFGKLGIAKIKTRAKGAVAVHQDNKYSVFTGVGAEYDLSPGMKVRAEYEYFTKDLSQISVGLNWSPNERMHYLDVKRSTIPAALPMNVITPGTPSRQKPVMKKRIQKVQTMRSSLTGNSLFASGSSRLSANGINRLNQLINKIRKKSFKLYHIVVSGHTDNRGSHRQNMHLSKNRAEAVARYMSSRGVPRHLMSVVGVGEARPVSTNNTAYGRALNRRVDIKIKGASSYVASR
ncbi:MAG: OmpA family protein [Thiotrichaceae bacterium]